MLTFLYIYFLYIFRFSLFVLFQLVLRVSLDTTVMSFVLSLLTVRTANQYVIVQRNHGDGCIGHTTENGIVRNKLFPPILQCILKSLLDNLRYEDIFHEVWFCLNFIFNIYKMIIISSAKILATYIIFYTTYFFLIGMTVTLNRSAFELLQLKIMSIVAWNIIEVFLQQKKIPFH